MGGTAKGSAVGSLVDPIGGPILGGVIGGKSKGNKSAAGPATTPYQPPEHGPAPYSSFPASNPWGTAAPNWSGGGAQGKPSPGMPQGPTGGGGVVMPATQQMSRGKTPPVSPGIPGSQGISTGRV